MFEHQGSTNLSRYQDAALRLAQIFELVDDRTRCQTVIDKFMGYARGHGSKAQYKQALELILPDSPIYSFLEGRLLHPELTYIRIADIIEAEEKEQINREIGERRTRLGAKLSQVTADVKREVLVKSKLEDTYHNVINWSTDDTVRRSYEEKLLSHAYETLLVLPSGQKMEKRPQVYDLARGMVVIHHDYLLAWTLYLEWQDVKHIGVYDPTLLREFIQLFPTSGLASVLKGYLFSPISPFPDSLNDDAESEPGSNAPRKSTKDPTEELNETDQDPLLIMSSGLEDAEHSFLAHRLMAEMYLHLEEYESAMETARKAISLLQQQLQQIGLMCIENYEATNLILATALIYYQSPRNHPDAQAIFEGVLQRSPHSASALTGQALILQEQEQYPAATELLLRALESDEHNDRVRMEAAWCLYLQGKVPGVLEQIARMFARYQSVKTQEQRTQVHMSLQNRNVQVETIYG